MAGLKSSEARHPTIGHSWVADVETSSAGASSWISANWIVPSAPVNQSNQTVYSFPGLVPRATNDTILQPVLGWNANVTDHTWTIASWNCCRNGNNIHSPLQTVTAGGSIYGYVWGTNCNGGVCSTWQVSTSESGGPITTLNTDSYGEMLDWSFSAALEVYNIVSCDQYPPSNQISFQNVTWRDSNGTTVQPTWSKSLYTVDPTCGRDASYTPTTATITWSVFDCSSCSCGCDNTGLACFQRDCPPNYYWDDAACRCSQ
jgi:hypothetical protein